MEKDLKMLKVKARSAVFIALRAGKITRMPCMVCGDEKSETHHPDYSKPLEVMWLCKKDHATMHEGIRVEFPMSKKQEDVLNFVTRFLVRFGYPPTYEEIAKGLGFHSRHHAKYFVYALVKRGRIKLDGSQRMHRKIRIV